MQSIMEGALPTTNKFKEMQDELEYKQMQLENTQVGEGALCAGPPRAPRWAVHRLWCAECAVRCVLGPYGALRSVLCAPRVRSLWRSLYLVSALQVLMCERVRMHQRVCVCVRAPAGAWKGVCPRMCAVFALMTCEVPVRI